MSLAASAGPQSVDTVFLGRVITLNPSRDVLSDGAVAVMGPNIMAVGPRADVLRSYAGRQVTGGPRAIILPGMIDTPTHCTQCFVRALTANELPRVVNISTLRRRAPPEWPSAP